MTALKVHPATHGPATPGASDYRRDPSAFNLASPVRPAFIAAMRSARIADYRLMPAKLRPAGT
ncbi:hypothetical protein CK227_13500 [Mesorhizobium sp. WSM4308]|nr:hypothetical protein CK232_17745 [Mesorhizobium sp. WSM4304]PBB74984.1 hypothetical protein CK227_13500 [Mesorhizobium sp. WSM4308]